VKPRAGAAGSCLPAHGILHIPGEYKMNKKVILSVMICCMIFVFSGDLTAFDWGFKFGLNQAGFNISNKDLPVDYESRLLFVFGGFIDFNISQSFSIQPEVNITAKGVDFYENLGGLEWKYRHTIGYVEFPLLLKYRIPFKGRSIPEIFAGPYYARKVESGIVNIFDNGSEFMIDEQTDWEEELRDWESGLVFGASLKLDFCLAKFILEARYSLGLTNIVKSGVNLNGDFGALYVFGEKDKIRNKVFSIMVGLGF
jgi:hypothetical protein